MIPITIGQKKIGPGQPTYIVAEISANHHQDFQEALRLIQAVHASGADAVKLQTYTPETMTMRSDRREFRITGGTLWDGRTLHDLYSQASMPWEWQPKLKEIANNLGMELFSTAFDPSAVDFLEQMNVPVHKIASFEIVDIPLIRRMAATGKPLIISTGMASRSAIEEALDAARGAGVSGIALLKCTSAYPALPESMNLQTIPHMAEAFQVPVGLSDHTLGIAVPVVAVALGACLVEKHVTLSRSTPGPDSAFSLEPDELKAMVDAIRTAEKSIGCARYGAGPEEWKSMVFRRSLFVVEEIKTGETFTERNVRSIRPGHGLHPRYFSAFNGRVASREIAAGTPLAWAHLAVE